MGVVEVKLSSSDSEENERPREMWWRISSGARKDPMDWVIWRGGGAMVSWRGICGMLARGKSEYRITVPHKYKVWSSELRSIHDLYCRTRVQA